MIPRIPTPLPYLALGFLAFKAIVGPQGTKPVEDNSVHVQVLAPITNNTAPSTLSTQPTATPIQTPTPAPPVQRFKEVEYSEWKITVPEHMGKQSYEVLVYRTIPVPYSVVSRPFPLKVLRLVDPIGITGIFDGVLPSTIHYEMRRILVRETRERLVTVPARGQWIRKIKQVPISDGVDEASNQRPVPSLSGL